MARYDSAVFTVNDGSPDIVELTHHRSGFDNSFSVQQVVAADKPAVHVLVKSLQIVGDFTGAFVERVAELKDNPEPE